MSSQKVCNIYGSRRPLGISVQLGCSSNLEEERQPHLYIICISSFILRGWVYDWTFVVLVRRRRYAKDRLSLDGACVFDRNNGHNIIPCIYNLIPNRPNPMHFPHDLVHHNQRKGAWTGSLFLISFCLWMQNNHWLPIILSLPYYICLINCTTNW